MQVAVIGLGSMGMGAELSLLRAGHAVAGLEPRPEARAAFADAGGTAVAQGADLPQGTEAVVVFTVNAAQAAAAIFGPQGAAPRLARDAVLIVSATMAPADARDLAAQAAALGLLYVDAPVSGGAARASCPPTCHASAGKGERPGSGSA